MRVSTLPTLALIATAALVAAHDPHKDEGHTMDWGARHMLEEHHLDNFDPGAFFQLHDFDESNTWQANEILRTYGINVDSSRLVDDTGNDDETPKGYVNEDTKAKILKEVLGLIDSDKSGDISLDEFMHFWQEGGRLPDFGLGPGHHGDDEYEYEIHHYEKYHDENTREEDLTHPEDIAHFKKHEEEHRAEEAFAKQEKLKIVEANIPKKFRVQ